MRLLVEGDTTFALGMNDRAAPDEFQPGEVKLIENGRLSLVGNSVRRRMGAKHVVTSTPWNTSIGIDADRIKGGKFYEFTSSSRYHVVIALAAGGETVYTSADYGATWTSRGTVSISAGIAPSMVVMTEGGNQVLCIATGGADAYQLNNTTLTTISGIPASTRFLAVHGNRLIAAGSGITVSASKVSDIDAGYGAPEGWTVQAQTHDDDYEITGLHTLGSIIMVFKRRSVGFIEGFGFTTLQVEVGSRGLTRSLGCVSSASIQAIGDDGVMWLSDQGWVFYRIGDRPVLVSGSQQALVNGIQFDIIRTFPNVVSSLYYPAEQEYWCAVPTAVRYQGARLGSGGGSGGTHIFVWRPPTPSRPPASYRFLLSTGDDHYTASIDSGGYLALTAAPGGQQGTTFGTYKDYLGLASSEEVGLDFVISDNCLALAVDLNAPAAMWTGATATREQAPFIGTVAGAVLEAEHPTTDVDDQTQDTFGSLTTTRQDGAGEIHMTLHARPYLFENQLSRKKAKRVRVQSSQAADSSVTATMIVDGVPGAPHTLSFSGAAHGRPEQRDARVGGRGLEIETVLQSTDDVDIHAVAVLAQPLEDEA